MLYDLLTLIFSSSPSDHDLQVLVYEDEGVNQASADALVAQMQYLLDPSISVLKVDSFYLNNHSWEKKTICLCMGGGKCGEWEKSLGESGMKKIHDYVVNGGTYIGLCAGAYFASAESLFKLNGQLIEKKRPVALSPFRAEGPIFQTDDYLSVSAAKTVQVAFHIEGAMLEGYVYYQGGCSFIIDQEQSIAKAAAHLKTHDSEHVVAVYGDCGKGRFYLCGLHPEFSWSENLKNATDGSFAKLANTLCPQEPFRQKIWKEIAIQLALPLKRDLLYTSMANLTKLGNPMITPRSAAVL
jgi:biotin--protein ligase